MKIPIPWGTITRTAAAALVVLWAWLIFAWFLRSNTGLLPGGAMRWGVFSGLFGNYTFSLANTPPLELLQALFTTALAVTFGHLLLLGLSLRLRWYETLTVGYTIGAGLSAFAFVLLTMAGGLHPIPSWILWGLLLGGAAWLARNPPALLTQIAPGTERPEDDDEDGGRDLLFHSFHEMPPWKRLSVLLMALIALAVTLTTFWHALFYPETYWDSLILYLGYGRMIFLENGFPFKAEAQVGIGLGANYPHLYSMWGVLSSMMFNHWSDLHLRLAAPLAGAATMLLVYFTCLRVWSDHLVAAMAALLFRALPNGIAYSTYASDYAFALLFSAAFVHAMVVFLGRRTWGSLALFTAIPAIGMNLNYLMGILWVPWLAVVVLLPGMAGQHATFLRRTLALATARPLWIIYIACILIATPWYARNYVMTGNPVYSFFPEIFTQSRHVNVEVLRSAEIEWFRNGDGISRVAELYHDWEAGIERDEGDPDYTRKAALRHRLASSFLFWVGFDLVHIGDDGEITTGGWAGRLAQLARITEAAPSDPVHIGGDVLLFPYRHSYKMMPLFPAFFFPALAAALLWMAWRFPRGENREAALEWLFLLGTLILAFSLLGYMYLLADFYLYQIIGIAGPAAIIAGALLAMVGRGRAGAWLLGALVPLVLLQGLVPGLAFGLMNFKFTRGGADLYGQPHDQLTLDAFRNPGMPPELFYRLQYGRSPDMWDRVNNRLAGERILTHENRHYVFDPSITLVHLDDWDIQQGWDREDPREILEFLRSHDLGYYLRTENEARHPVNRRLGMHLLEEAGMLETVYTAGSDTLFRLVGPDGE